MTSKHKHGTALEDTMNKDIRTALYWVSGYMLGTVLLTTVVGAFVLAARTWS